MTATEARRQLKVGDTAFILSHQRPGHTPEVYERQVTRVGRVWFHAFNAGRFDIESGWEDGEGRTPMRMAFASRVTLEAHQERARLVGEAHTLAHRAKFSRLDGPQLLQVIELLRLADGPVTR